MGDFDDPRTGRNTIFRLPEMRITGLRRGKDGWKFPTGGRIVAWPWPAKRKAI
jgi:hypothetical protein